jgi:hypothetical protein
MNPDQFRTNLNLLPSGYRRRVLVRTALVLWSCVGVAALSAAGLAVWHADRELKVVRNELSRHERMYAPSQLMAYELGTMRERLVELDSEETAAAELEDDRPTLALLGMIGRASEACGGKLHVRECQLGDRPAERGTTSAEGQLLTLRGAALDLLCIAQFHGILRDSRMFSRVELRPTTNEQIGEVTGHAFHIECAF